MTIDEMRKVISNDPETKSLDILDVDVNKVYQYLVQRKERPVVDGYEIVLRTDPYIEIVYRPTKEKAQEIKKEKN